MINSPTETQIKRCRLMGWQYIGDGLFTLEDDILSWIGYFNGSGFCKEEC